MNKNLLFTILLSITLTSTLTTWASYEPSRPWGWTGPNDEEIAQIRVRCKQQTEEKNKEKESEEKKSQGNFLTILEQLIITSAIISENEPDTAQEIKTELVIKQDIKQNKDADYCTIS